jgi:hypothetical protein
MKPEELRQGYIGWNPNADYMWKDGHGWDTRKKYRSEEYLRDWFPSDFDYNQVVDFYFERITPSVKCEACNGVGYNPETKKLSDDWYTHLRTDGKRGWSENLTQDEVQALFDQGRMFGFKKCPTAAEANAWFRKNMHDAINHWICVEVRAKRLGVWGNCEHCGGKGYIPTEPEMLTLNLWMTHPRKGASRGIEITHIPDKHLPIYYGLLGEWKKRLIKRFENVPETSLDPKFMKKGLPDIAGLLVGMK